jgi:hypothetical protein
MDNFWAHSAKRCVQTMDDLRMRGAPQPPFRSNIAMPDLLFFGWLRGELSSRPFADAVDRFYEVTAIMASPSVEALHRAFLKWIRIWKKQLQPEILNQCTLYLQTSGTSLSRLDY